MPVDKVVIWTSEYSKLFKNACKKGTASSQFYDQLVEIISLLDNEYTFLFDKSSNYSSLFTVPQPSSPSTLSPIAQAAKNNSSTPLTPFVAPPTTNTQQPADAVLVQSSQQEKKKRLQATTLFLDLWKYLLSVIELIPFNERKLAFRIMARIMKRREFDVSHFKSSNMYPDLYATPTTKKSKSKPIPTNSPSPLTSQSTLSNIFSAFGLSSSENSTDKLEQQVLRTFLQLSFQTQEYVIKNVLSSKQHNAIYEELYTFCAQVLAINCFRLFSPNDTKSFIESLCFRCFNNRFVSAESQDIIRRNIDGDESREIQMKYTPSTESFRTLLTNSKKQNPIYQQAPEEETEESRHVVSRMFRCYKVFFTNELQSEKRVLTDTDKKNLIGWVQNASTYLPKFMSSHLFFFTFYTEFVRQIGRIMSTETVDYWKYAPGYRMILAHYVEIALQNVKNYMKKDLYPEPTSNYGRSLSNWIGCSFVSMKNPIFLNVLMEIFFKHTNGYNLDQVFFSLVWIESWFRELSIVQHHFQSYLLNSHKLRERLMLSPKDGGSNRPRLEIFIGELPPNFHYEFFEQAIDSLLSTHHFQIITRTLIFLYEVLDMFNGKERLKLIYEFLLKKHFFALFLHWSEDARACFHRILTYKIHRYSKSDFLHIAQMMHSNPAQVITGPLEQSSTTSAVEVDKTGRRSMDNEDRPRRTSLSGPRPSLDGDDDARGRTSLDLQFPRYSTVEDPFAPKPKLSFVKRVGKKISSKKNQACTAALLDEHLLSSEFQRTEEAIDLVLKSKADSYIEILRSYVRKDKSGVLEDEHDPHLAVPAHLVHYIPKALKQYAAIEREAMIWKQNTTDHLLQREKKMVITGQLVQLRRIAFPRISFPKFVMFSERPDSNNVDDPNNPVTQQPVQQTAVTK